VPGNAGAAGETLTKNAGSSCVRDIPYPVPLVEGMLQGLGVVPPLGQTPECGMEFASY